MTFVCLVSFYLHSSKRSNFRYTLTLLIKLLPKYMDIEFFLNKSGLRCFVE